MAIDDSDGSAPETLTALLARVARLEGEGGREPTGLRLLDRRERETFVSWGALDERARAVGARLAAAGVGPGDRVALVFPTGAPFFDAFFGTLAAGAVPVPLYPPVRLGRLDEYHRRTARMIEAAGARLVLADPRVARLLGEAVERSRPPLGCRSLDRLPASTAAGELPGASTGPDDLGLVQFSSGTTVEPKPVALTHRALLAQTRALNGFWPDTGDIVHRGASWLPLYHDMGLVGCVFPALERRTDLALVPPELFVARPAAWLRTISRYRATVSPAPNFAYSLAVAKIRDEELDGVDLSSWRVALNGAETVSAETLRAFARRFAPWGFRPEALTPVYGLSEAALAVAFSAVDRPFVARRFARETLAPGGAEPVRERPDDDGGAPGSRELVSVGRPLPGFALEIRDASGRALPERRVGRVWARGPSLMAGYLGRPEATARALVDGWLDTGDLGFLLDGELHLTGRAKDVVIVRGRNFGPEEIEVAASSVPGARTGCAVAASVAEESAGEAPSEGSERLLVFVERARGAADTEGDTEIEAAVRREVLAAVGVAPARVLVLEPGTLPRTSSGKLRRGETVRRFEAGELAPPERVSFLRMAGALVRSRMAHARARRGGAGADAAKGEGGSA